MIVLDNRSHHPGERELLRSKLKQQGFKRAILLTESSVDAITLFPESKKWCYSPMIRKPDMKIKEYLNECTTK